MSTHTHLVYTQKWKSNLPNIWIRAIENYHGMRSKLTFHMNSHHWVSHKFRHCTKKNLMSDTFNGMVGWRNMQLKLWAERLADPSPPTIFIAEPNINAKGKFYNIYKTTTSIKMITEPLNIYKPRPLSKLMMCHQFFLQRFVTSFQCIAQGCRFVAKWIFDFLSWAGFHELVCVNDVISGSGHM